ncbi:MAG: hypothetical protein M0Q93_12415 [Terrimicrobiaceae bacterium]|nr:hypothetical protein [Terrimicrobiaceae bacterium]
MEKFVWDMAPAATHYGELIGWIELVVTQRINRGFDGDYPNFPLIFF